MPINSITPILPFHTHNPSSPSMPTPLGAFEDSKTTFSQELTTLERIEELRKKKKKKDW